MQTRLLLILLLTPCLAAPLQAGIFGRKKEKIDPKSRVPELVVTLASDGDADKRARAAEELRNYDATTHPEIVPALIQALHTDKKPSVRSEAAQSLGKIRPVTQAAGEALEQATSNDPSYRVRLTARSALLNCHWAGYRSGKTTDVPPLSPTTKEPPIIDTTKSSNAAPPKMILPQPQIQPQVQPQPSRSRWLPFRSPFRSSPTTTPPQVPSNAPMPSTKEPPLAPPLNTPATMPTPASSAPIPMVPTTSVPPTTTVAPPIVTTSPGTVKDIGPDLP